MVTIAAGSAVRTPLVPGAELRLRRPLLPAAITRAPYVPGALLQTATEDPFRAELYTYPDLTTPIAALDLTRPRVWEWQDLKSEPGAGTLVLQNDDPALASFADDGTDIIVFYYRALRAFAMIAEQKQAVLVSSDEERAETTTYQGRGLLALLDFAIVDPTGGPYRSPVESDRYFGWPTQGFDHTTWDDVSVLGTVNEACIQFALALTAVTGGDFFEIVAGLVNEVDSRFPARLTIFGVAYALVLGPPGQSITYPTVAPGGDCYFYEEFTIATAGDYVFWPGVDNAGTFYFDGQQVGNIDGVNWFAFASIAVTLSAGTHSVAAKVTNVTVPGVVYNPIKWAWVLTDETQALATANPSDAGLSVIAQATGAAKVLAFPAEVPGQTVTKTMRIALEEAQARGFLAGLTWDFTDTNYSDGAIAEPVADIATKTGTTVLEFFAELASTYIDMAMDVAGPVLHAWAKGQGGSLTAADLHSPTDPDDPSSGNLISYEHHAELRAYRRFLLRWQGGWAEDDRGGIGGEASLEIGAPASLDEVYRIADGQLDTFSTPRTEITAGLDYFGVGDIDSPYYGFNVKDQVTTPDGVEYVLGITVAIPADLSLPPQITISLRDLILTPEERQTNDLRKLT